MVRRRIVAFTTWERTTTRLLLTNHLTKVTDLGQEWKWLRKASIRHHEKDVLEVFSHLLSGDNNYHLHSTTCTCFTVFTCEIVAFMIYPIIYFVRICHMKIRYIDRSINLQVCPTFINTGTVILCCLLMCCVLSFPLFTAELLSPKGVSLSFKCYQVG